MLVATLFSMYTFGRACGFDRARLLRFAEESLPPIAERAARRRRRRRLRQRARRGWGRHGDRAGRWSGLALSPLVLGWVIASLLRLSVGSATVAVVTAAGIMAPIAAAMPHVNKELLVVAIGAGSLIASHVNDGGFWLVKEYLNMSGAADGGDMDGDGDDHRRRGPRRRAASWIGGWADHD